MSLITTSAARHIATRVALALCSAAVALVGTPAANAQMKEPAGSDPCPEFSVGGYLRSASAWVKDMPCAEGAALTRKTLRDAAFDESWTDKNFGTAGMYVLGGGDAACVLGAADRGIALKWWCNIGKWDGATIKGTYSGGTLKFGSFAGRRCPDADYYEGIATRFVLRKLACSSRVALMRGAALGGARAAYNGKGASLTRVKGMWCVGRFGAITSRYKCVGTNGRAARFTVQGS